MKDLEKKPRIPHNFTVTHFWEPNEHLAKKLSRKISFVIQTEDLGFLTEKQKERFLFLVGHQRITRDKKRIIIKVDFYEDSYDNYLKGKDILHELYLETLRAP